MKEYKVSDYEILIPGETRWTKLRERLSAYFWMAVIVIVVKALV